MKVMRSKLLVSNWKEIPRHSTVYKSPSSAQPAPSLVHGLLQTESLAQHVLILVPCRHELGCTSEHKGES